MTRKTPKPHRDPKQFIRFLVIAVIIMVFVDFFIFRDGRPYFYDEISQTPIPPVDAVLVQPLEGEYFEAPAQTELKKAPEFKDYILEFDMNADTQVDKQVEEVPMMPESTEMETEEDSVEIPPIIFEETDKRVPGQRGKIAIVIDDMGMNLTQSRAAIALPSEVTLAFLPYAAKVKPLAEIAKRQGHEIIIHAPMEAMSSDVPLGSMAFTSDMDYARFTQEFEKIISSFDGHVGLNNHMGSKLTQDKERMAYLMDNLKQRDMYFLDSRTIHTSVALELAEAYGVPAIERDIFLDHEETPQYTAEALASVENIAKQTGSAIAIGHPKAITIDALNAWIPTLESKGLELVKVSEIITDNQQTSDITQSVSRETLVIHE